VSATFVAVEVWLGPMEGLRYAAPVEGGRALIRIGRISVEKKSNVKNQFVLSYGHSVSSLHAELRYERGHLYVKDAGSTNGTFVEGHQVTEEEEIQPGDVFLISSTPVRARLTDQAPPEMPFPRVLRGEAWPDPAVQNIIRGAREAAVQRGELFVDTRHLCDALLRSRSSTIQRILREAAWSREQALTELWEGHLFSGAYAWLNDLFLQPIGVKTGSDELIVSPKVGFLLEECQRHHVESSALDLETMLRHELIRLLRSDEESAIGSWLSRRLPGEAPPASAAPKPSAKRAAPPPPPPPPYAAPPHAGTPREAPPPAETPPPPTPPAPPAAPRREVAPAKGAPGAETVFIDRVADLLDEGEAVAQAESTKAGHLTQRPVEAAAPALPLAPLTEEDVALDRRARSLADALVSESAAYRFSTPADRREALKTLVLREYRSLAPERRRRLLEQLRLQFPISVSPPAANVEEPRLRRRIAELERRLADAASRSAAEPAPAPSAVPWKELLSREEADVGALDPPLAVLREILQFSLDVETFMLGLVESVTMPGSETLHFRLPNFRDRLSLFLAAAAEGRLPNPEDVHAYLSELQRWQIAISAAHHEAPKLWFTRLWKKINPAVIESMNREAGWKLRGETVEWWNQYRGLVQDLNPDLVQDQVLQAASQFAQTEFQKLSKRKGTQ
jgi:hypothetical protein